jgi:hypothetical protein
MTILKVIVAALALANLLYFLWTHGIAEQYMAPAAPLKSLKLVSEAPPAQRPRAADLPGLATSNGVGEQPGDAGSGSLAPNAKRCVTIGPFRDVAEAAHAASTLRAGGYDPRQRVVDGDVWAGIWVYVAEPAGPGAGEQLLTKLKAAGIDDALEMPGPAEASVISLGLFSEQKRAEARVAQAQALGLNPSLSDRKRTGNVYWIDVDLKPADGMMNPANLQNEAGRISRLEVEACPEPVAP